MRRGVARDLRACLLVFGLPSQGWNNATVTRSSRGSKARWSPALYHSSDFPLWRHCPIAPPAVLRHCGCTGVLWALAHAEQGWLAAVLDSLHWLWGHLLGQPCAEPDWAQLRPKMDHHHADPAWVLESFKAHGRCAAHCGLLTGRQCESCLRHFGTNLCKHLAYSSECRHRLSVAGFNCPAC